jgi:multiple sugar transport system ATP-binding protein
MSGVVLAHVSKRFGEVTAVRDLSAVIPDGAFFVLVGPSGCGKTTVLRLIAGLETPDSGTILIDGRVVNDVRPGDRDVTMVFEGFALYPHLAVRDNLAFGLRLRRTPTDEIGRRVSAVTEAMELGRLLDRRPAVLATGQAQHVAIGRSLVREHPSVFLLDDALAHLDARQRLEARTELLRLHRDLGATIVSVTHDQAEALAVGSVVGVMDAGTLVQVGTPRTLYERPADVFVAGFIGTPPMNLLAMSVTDDAGRLVLRSSALSVPLPEAAVAIDAAAAGSTITVGIRPEHVAVAAIPGEGTHGLLGRCELVEYMGHHVLVHVAVDDVRLRAFDDPARHLRVGDDVVVAIDPDRLHLFDTRTGRAILAPRPAGDP